MQKSRILGAVCACLLSFTGSPGVASVIYTYTGNPFDDVSSPYNTTMSVTATLELAAALGNNLTDQLVGVPVFTVHDGIHTITQDNVSGVSFEFSTNAVGTITEWHTGVDILSDFNDVGETVLFIVTTTDNPVFVADYGSKGICTVKDDCIANQDTERGIIRNAPGTWEVSSVPVPAAA